MLTKHSQPNLRLKMIRLQQFLGSSLAQQLKHSVFARIDCQDAAGKPDRFLNLNAVEILQTNRYINSVQIRNLTALIFPSNLKAMVFGYKGKT